MIAEEIFTLDVPATHREVIEHLAARDTKTAAAWAMTGQATDQAIITALTKNPVRDLPLPDTGILTLSDTVIGAVVKGKRASITSWAATQHVSEPAAITLAAAGPKAAANILRTGYSTAACHTAIRVEHGPKAAEWMLETGDYTHLDAIDFTTFTGRHGKWLIAFIAAENPDDYDRITAGPAGAWIRAGSHRLTVADAEQLCLTHPDTIMSIAWNPYLSPTAIREAGLVDLAAAHCADPDAVDKARDALQFRHNRYGDKIAAGPRTEADPDTLGRLIRRACRDDYQHPRHADLIDLLANPNLTVEHRERLAQFALGTGVAPARISFGWAQQLNGTLSESLDAILVHDQPQLSHWTDEYNQVDQLDDDTPLFRFNYRPEQVAAYLFAHLPPRQEVWEAADLLWETSQQMTVQQFCQIAQTV